MNQLKAIDLCKLLITDSHKSVLYHQKLIDKWNDPEDIAVRAAVLIKKIHSSYGEGIYSILNHLDTNCKHPKKMQDTCNGIVYCMDCNMDIKVISKKKHKKQLKFSQDE